MKAQKFTLLVVDDNEDERFFIQKAFQSLATKYRIHALDSGNETLAYLKGEGKYRDRTKFQFPAYIITNLKMSNGDGFEILDLLKKNPALSVIPVVMLSTSDDPDDIRQVYLPWHQFVFRQATQPTGAPGASERTFRTSRMRGARLSFGGAWGTDSVGIRRLRILASRHKTVRHNVV